MPETKTEEPSETASSRSRRLLDRENGLKITLISLHGLIRAHEPELGCDADTGGQVIYVLELARELASQPQVREVELLTRQIIDPKVSDDYAQLEEEISENAKLIRIPFGPRRYLKKEALWPYVDHFVDQTLVHFRRTGIPDIIHGHYADAGLAGAQLSRLLHVPYIFTGHSALQVLAADRGRRDCVGDCVDGRHQYDARGSAAIRVVRSLRPIADGGHSTRR